MMKWALGIFGVLVGLAVTVRIGKREASRLLDAMAATDGSDEVGPHYARDRRVTWDDAKPVAYLRYGYLQGQEEAGVRDPATGIIGPVSFKAGGATFENCYFEDEEPAVRRARLHIAARRDLQ